MQRLRPSFFSGLAALAALLAGGLLGDRAEAAGAVVKTGQVRAELIAHAPEGVVAGKPLQLGLKIEHQPEWHTYWRNPGDSGLPTTLEWTLPPGVTPGDIAWPTPRKLPVGPMVNYGYDGTLLLPVSFEVDPAFKASTLAVKLQAQWLVCKDVCIPEQGEFALEVPAQAATGLHGALFEAARRAQPAEVEGLKAAAQVVNGDTLDVTVRGMPAAWRGRDVDFLAELAGVIDHAAKAPGRWQDDAWRAAVPLSRERTESPATMHAVLTTPGQPAGLRVALDIRGPWPSTPASSGAAEASAPTTSGTTSTIAQAPTSPTSPLAPETASMTLWMALLLALGGGLLLNLMPCVLPVLSLKILGLTAHEHDAGGPRARVASGLAYTAGVVLSFLALAAALLVLRGAGEAVGWGFQLQSPAVVAALAGLFTLIGLNLAGVFEVGTLLGGLAGTRAKRPWVDAGLTGVLAVAVAAPCTAPFMGAALGFAVGLPAPQALLIFAALGLGLALPFLLVSLVPALARWLPKPGAWMLRFKVAMAFPMFATVVWLVWVLGQQSGIDAAAALLAVLVALAFAAWAWAGRGQGWGWLWSGAGIAVTAMTLAWAWPYWHAAPPQATVAAGQRWESWSPERMAAHQAAGRPVFVDFTAAWCVTCQVNKRSTLGQAEVLAALDRRGVVTMRADWTRRDAVIAAELTRLRRSGVPVYALYEPGSDTPMLLPELLSPSVVIDAVSSRSH